MKADLLQLLLGCRFCETRSIAVSGRRESPVLIDDHTAFLQPVQLFYQAHQLLKRHVLVWLVLSSLAALPTLPGHPPGQLGG